MFCTNCGSQIKDGVKFCTNCGTPMKVMDTPVMDDDDERTVCVAPAAPVMEDDDNERTVAFTPVFAAEAAPAEEAPVEEAPQAEPPIQEPEVFDIPVEKPKKKKASPKTIIAIVLAIVVVAGAGTGLGLFFKSKADTYAQMEQLLEEKNYTEAIALLEKLGGYSDSKELLAQLQDNQTAYDAAKTMIENKQYGDAINALKELEDYADCEALVKDLEDKQEKYDAAITLMDEGKYDEAKAAFAGLGDYADSAVLAATDVDYQKATYLMTCAANKDEAGLTVLHGEGTAVSGDEIDLAVILYRGAGEIFAGLGDHSDSPAKAQECYVAMANLELERQNWDGVKAAMDLMDEDTYNTFYEIYITHCADATILEDLAKALHARDALIQSGEYTIEDLVNVESEYLEKYLEMHFDDEDLAALVGKYFEGLFYQIQYLESTDENSQVLWYQGSAMRYEAINGLNEKYAFLEGDDLRDTFVGKTELQWAYAHLTEMFFEQAIGVPATENSDGTYHLELNNTTDYGFVLVWSIECLKDDQIVHESDVIEIPVPQGETVKIPVDFPKDTDFDRWLIDWDFVEITKDGELLPGQEG